MTQAQEYYTIDAGKLQAIAEAAGMADDVEAVRAFCLADWAEGQEHQSWLDIATVEEIADWVNICRDPHGELDRLDREEEHHID